MQEGNSAERFQELYGGMPRVRTPGIKWDYTARRVLTMEWIEGVKLTNKPVGFLSVERRVVGVLTMEWIEGVKLTNKPVCFLSVERRVVGKIRKRRVGDKRAGAVHECGKACCW